MLTGGAGHYATTKGLTGSMNAGADAVACSFVWAAAAPLLRLPIQVARWRSGISLSVILWKEAGGFR